MPDISKGDFGQLRPLMPGWIQATGKPMSTESGEDSKTAWDKTAEQEWIDEQWAADEHRRAHQSAELQLQPEAATALSHMSPAGRWQQLTDLVLKAVEEQWDEAEKLGKEFGLGEFCTYPKDLDQLYIRATELNPIFAINEFNYVNPEVRLDDPRLFERIDPLQALRAVIRMWTENNHRTEAL
jgi:hypothetical protein